MESKQVTEKKIKKQRSAIKKYSKLEKYNIKHMGIIKACINKIKDNINEAQQILKDIE